MNCVRVHVLRVSNVWYFCHFRGPNAGYGGGGGGGPAGYQQTSTYQSATTTQQSYKPAPAPAPAPAYQVRYTIYYETMGNQSEVQINQICHFGFFWDVLFLKTNIEGWYSIDRNNTCVSDFHYTELTPLGKVLQNKPLGLIFFSTALIYIRGKILFWGRLGGGGGGGSNWTPCKKRSFQNPHPIFFLSGIRHRYEIWKWSIYSYIYSAGFSLSYSNLDR